MWRSSWSQMKCLQNVRSLVFRWAFTQTILARAAKETIGGSTGDDDDDDDNYDQDDESVTCDVKKMIVLRFWTFESPNNFFSENCRPFKPGPGGGIDQVSNKKNIKNNDDNYSGVGIDQVSNVSINVSSSFFNLTVSLLFCFQGIFPWADSEFQTIRFRNSF